MYFGVGLLDPVDEPGDANPPSHPKLLDELTRRSPTAEYDLKVLVRGLTASRAYQLTSRQTDDSQADPRRFARMNLKGLNGGQIYDSFVVATGYRGPVINQQYYDPAQNNNISRFAFRTLFPIPQKPTETQTSILQALTVMNGKLVADQTSVSRGEVLAAVADAPFLDTAGKVESLFYARPHPQADGRGEGEVHQLRGPRRAERGQEQGAGGRVLGAAEQRPNSSSTIDVAASLAAGGPPPRSGDRMLAQGRSPGFTASDRIP